MLRFQIALAIILVGCTAFLSCGRIQDPLADPVAEVMEMPMEMEMETPMDMDMEMEMEMVTEMMAVHKSWDSVMLPAPMMTVEEAKAAMNPGATGQAHGEGSRTVYINEVGAMANRAGTAYPVGTVIVKEVMDVTETFVMHVATMAKTDDPMYAAHNGWMYGVAQRDSADKELMMPMQLSVEMAQGCHDCHAKASEIIRKPTDSVFVSLPMMAEGMADEGMADEGMGDDGDGGAQ